MFNMLDCNPAFTPMENGLEHKKVAVNNNRILYHQANWKLLYIMITSRPNTHVLHYDDSHWIAIKMLLHYLKGSRNLAIIYHHLPQSPDLTSSPSAIATLTGEATLSTTSPSPATSSFSLEAP